MEMDIRAKEGCKVVYDRPNAGYDQDRESAKENLDLKETYTVDCTVVGTCNTIVYLKEVPNIGFNTVNFSAWEETYTVECWNATTNGGKGSKFLRIVKLTDMLKAPECINLADMSKAMYKELCEIKGIPTQPHILEEMERIRTII